MSGGGAIRAVLWDFGGVILSSPFDAFTHYEERNGLPPGFIRGLNAQNPHDNAWAKLERNEASFEEFCSLFENEARAAGHEVRAAEILALLAGEVRPEMVEAVRRCRDHCKTGLITNNFVAPEGGMGLDGVLSLFDVIIESSKAGVRKPDPRIYLMACEALGIEPHEAVFLDDLGINLKPARELGMQTIKVVDPADALDQLERVVGFPVR